MLFLLAGCATSSGAGSASTNASSAQETSIPYGTWLVVRATTGRGLTEGSGVRLRNDGFDVVSGVLGQPMNGECVASPLELRCTGAGGEMDARLGPDGTIVLHQGPVELVLVRANDADAARFESTLANGEAQRHACGAAAQCCIAAENQLGTTCDLNALLGDRSLAACTAGLETARARFPAGAAPAECQ